MIHTNRIYFHSRVPMNSVNFGYHLSPSKKNIKNKMEFVENSI